MPQLNESKNFLMTKQRPTLTLRDERWRTYYRRLRDFENLNPQATKEEHDKASQKIIKDLGITGK